MNTKDFVLNRKVLLNMKYKLIQYEGWSVHNTKSMLSLQEGEHFIAFVSKTKIDEVSIAGIHKLLDCQVNLYKGLDIEGHISIGKYNSHNDSISHNLNVIPNIQKVSKHLQDYNKGLFKDTEDIVCVYYKAIPRYNKSTLWKLFNKQKSDIYSYI